MSLEEEVAALRRAVQTLTQAVIGATAPQHRPSPEATAEALDAIPPAGEPPTAAQAADLSLAPERNATQRDSNTVATESAETPPAEITSAELLALARGLIERGDRPLLQHLLTDELGVGALSDLKTQAQRAQFVALINSQPGQAA